MRALAVAFLTVAVLSGCGGGGSTPTQPAGSIKVTLTEFHFDPSAITVPSGKVVFFLINAGNNLSHDMIIRDSTGKIIGGSDLISSGDSTVFTVDNIAAGTYVIFCDQPGHESSGMKGTLTVT
ncbi:MAG TPA: plastocyanin/azurin family copper-binding protein [Clostridia bacterium]|nr:plastocyanin/azurin family copper-binding protein [Clostridia bacterium]